MKCNFEDYNIELRCTYFMSNCSLKELPKMFKIEIEKKVGDLDYNKIRHSKTELTETENGYCETDCLVIYYYIKEELKTYKRVDNIPLTSTSHVRRELKDIITTDFKYKRIVQKAINTDPHIYNMLVETFSGGYTHANWIYADEVLENIDSYDFTSSYPFVMVTHKFPSTPFTKCKIRRYENMSRRLAYMLRIRFKNIKSKCYNSYLSSSKCYDISGGRYDNGRILQADYLETVITDLDFHIIEQMYTYEQYEIVESYYSVYNFLPKTFIEFILSKYVNKTKYKGIKGMELEYGKEKNKFNALYRYECNKYNKR